jgi:glycerol-3-phosphate acyltransferase PlsY
VDFVGYIATALVAYLLGSIPTGFLVGKARGIDIRTVGSGNIGATNVFRMLGKRLGVLVMIVDMGKGALAVFILPLLAQRAGLDVGQLQTYDIIAGFGAIAGHNYTCWLGFKGGKGVATTGGVLFSLITGASAIGMGVWLITLAITRYVSVASIAAAISLPFGVWFCNLFRDKPNPDLIIVAAVFGALGIYKHKANIRRLWNGTEPRFGGKKNSEPTQ